MPQAEDGSQDEINSLYNALDNRDQTIVELEKRLGEIIDSAKNETRETQLQTDLEQAKHEIIQQRQVISELEAQVGHNVAQNDNDAADLKNLRDQVEIKNKTIETQRRQLQQAAQKVDLVDTQNKSGKGEVYRLESENLRLRELVRELESNEEDLAEEVGVIANERYSLEVKHQEMVRDMEKIKLLLDEKSNQCLHSEAENVLMIEKISAFEKNESNLIHKMNKMKEDHSIEVGRLKKELEKERHMNQRIDMKASLSFGKTVVEEQRSQMDEMNSELKLMTARTRKLETENEILKRDVDTACRKLEDAGIERAEAVLEIEEKHSVETRKLEEQIQNGTLRIERMNEQCRIHEEEISQAQERLRVSEERNSWYEQGKGLSDIVQHQKRLEADIRRRELERKKFQVEMGQKEDKLSVLAKTCEILKKDASEEVLAAIDEEKVEEMLQVEESIFCAQNRELSQQIDNLEDERNRLLKRLRENAAVVYEDGLFLGLSSIQMEQVVEFAGNLKDGSVQLPMTDNSTRLRAELDAINVQRQSDLCTIDRLEREIESLRLMKGSEDNSMLEELGMLKTTLTGIKAQNESFQGAMRTIASSQRYQSIVSENSEKGSQNSLSGPAKKKLEKIVGECVEATMLPIQSIDLLGKQENSTENCALPRDNHEPIEDKTQAIVESVKRNFELKLQEQRSDLKLSRSRIAELESQILERDSLQLERDISYFSTSQNVSKRNAQVQVETDRAHMRKAELELQATKESLHVCERKVSTYESRVNRLQEALKSESLFRDDKKRILMAHKALKNLLDEKNCLIDRFRKKELENKTLNFANKSKCMELCTRGTMRERVYQEENTQVSTISSLVSRLGDASNLLKEKDATIRIVKAELLDTKTKLDSSIEQYSRAFEELHSAKEVESDLLNDRRSVKEQLEDERSKSAGIVNDLRHQINIKDERISLLTKSSQRLKGALRSKNEESARLGELEADLNRTKSTLNAVRMRRANREKALSVSEQKCANALEDNSRLEKKLIGLEMQIRQVKDEKILAERRYRVARSKIQNLSANVGSVYDESKIECIEEDYKVTICALKNENSELRGIVASYKLKQDTNERTNNTGSFNHHYRKEKRHILQNTSNSKFRHIASKPADIDSVNKKHDTNEIETKHIQYERIKAERKINELTTELKMMKDIVMEKQNLIVTLQQNNSGVLGKNSSNSISGCSEKHISSSVIKAEVDNLRKKYEESQTELIQLEKQVKESSSNAIAAELAHKDEIEKLARRLSTSSKAQSSHGVEEKLSETTLSDKIVHLEDENRRLKKELNSFDLEFFEQLEDLKFNYNEAKMKISGHI